MKPPYITIIDSGIDTRHVAFNAFKIKHVQNSLKTQFSNNIGSEIIYYRGLKGDYIDDISGHGTAITYILAQYTSKILFYDVSLGKFKNSYHFGKNEVIKILRHAYFMGSRIVVMSFGSKYQNSTIEHQIDNFLFNHPDLNVFVAAGNRPGVASINSPGHCYNVITVGGGIRLNKEKTFVADFSAGGPSNDDNIKPDLLDHSVHNVPLSYTGTNFQLKKGTSFANAVLAGKASKVISDVKKGHPHLVVPSTLVKAILLYTSHKTSGVSYVRPIFRDNRKTLKYAFNNVNKRVDTFQQGSGFNAYQNMNDICYVLVNPKTATNYSKDLNTQTFTFQTDGYNKVVAVYLKHSGCKVDMWVNSRRANSGYHYNVRVFDIHNVQKRLRLQSSHLEMRIITDLNCNTNIAVVWGCHKKIDAVTVTRAFDRRSVNVFRFSVYILILYMVFKTFMMIRITITRLKKSY